MKCYAVISGSCWLHVEGEDSIALFPGDCYILPHGRPFQLATDRSVEAIDYSSPQAKQMWSTQGAADNQVGCLLIGGHFVLTGPQAELLLRPLPLVIHVKDERGKAAMLFSLNRMKDEVAEAQPGSALVVQQLAYAMLIHALRLYLDEERQGGTGWLFALTDQQLRDALTCMHRQPERNWNLHELATSVGMSRSAFALKFKQTVGASPMEYLTRWRMLLASRQLAGSTKFLIEIASSLGYESESAFGKPSRGSWEPHPSSIAATHDNTSRGTTIPNQSPMSNSRPLSRLLSSSLYRVVFCSASNRRTAFLTGGLSANGSTLCSCPSGCCSRQSTHSRDGHLRQRNRVRATFA